MDDAQRTRFEEQGYVIIESLLDPESDFAGISAAYDRVLDGLGAPRSDLPLSPARVAERTTALYAQTGSLFSQHLNICLPARAQLPPDVPMCLEPEAFDLLVNGKILDAVEGLIGPEIDVNPVNHVRIKPPADILRAGRSSEAVYDKINVTRTNGLMARTPWHQDNAVYTPDADDVDIVTVWFPLTEASIEAGCLKCIPGSHRQGLRGHCPSETTDLRIPEELVPEDPVLLPMKPGDVLFLHRRTAHASLDNMTDRCRWSFDLRYQPAGLPNGRNVLPSFTARSRARPEQVMTSAQAWKQMWLDTRARLSKTAEIPPPNRWSADAPMCA